MRVTKSIKNFIHTEVEKRLMPKYQTERDEANRQQNEYENFLEACFDRALATYNKYFDEHFAEIAEFVEDERDENFAPLSVHQHRAAIIKNRMEENNVHQWKRRYNKEVEQTVESIIVELELGGTKAELMEMLDKIGKGE